MPTGSASRTPSGGGTPGSCLARPRGRPSASQSAHSSPTLHAPPVPDVRRRSRPSRDSRRAARVPGHRRGRFRGDRCRGLSRARRGHAHRRPRGAAACAWSTVRRSTRAAAAAGGPPRALPVLVAGRAGRVLEAAGRVADRALLWAVPRSELERSVERIEAGVVAAGPGRVAPERIWAPLVAHDERHSRRSGDRRVLGAQQPAGPQRAWGLGQADVAAIRAALVAGGAAAAAGLVPDHVRGPGQPDPIRSPSAGSGGPRRDRSGPAGVRGQHRRRRVRWARDVLAAAARATDAIARDERAEAVA